MLNIGEKIRTHLCEFHSKPLNFICTEAICLHKQKKIKRSLRALQEIFDFIEYSLSQETQTLQQLQCSLRQIFRKNYELITELLELQEIQIEGFINSILIQENEVQKVLQPYIGKDIQFEDIQTLGAIFSETLELNEYKEYRYKKKVKLEDRYGKELALQIISKQEQMLNFLNEKSQYNNVVITQVKENDEQQCTLVSKETVCALQFQMESSKQQNVLLQSDSLQQCPKICEQHYNILSESLFSESSLHVQISEFGIQQVYPEVAEFQIQQVLELKKSCQWCCFNHNQTEIAVACEKKIIFFTLSTSGIWEMELQKLTEHTETICQVKFNNNSTILVTCSEDKSIIIWRRKPRGRWIIHQTIKQHSKCVNTIDFNTDFTILASGSTDSTIKIYSLIDKFWERQQILKEHTKEVFNVCFNHDSTILATTGDKWDPIILWNNVESKWCIQQKLFTDIAVMILRIKFNEDSSQLISESGDQLINIWSANGSQIWECQTTIQTNDDRNEVIKCKLSSSKQIIPSISKELIHICRQNTDNNWVSTQTIRKHKDLINCVIINNDYTMIVSVSDDGLMIVHKSQAS